MKRLAASTLALGLILAGVLIAPQAAFAATDVSGVVTEIDGTTAIAYVDVDVYQGGIPVDHTQTGLAGQFSFSDLAAGDYTVHFGKPGFAPEWYDNSNARSSATVVTVADGVPTVLNASLAVASTITGTITDYLGNPLNDVYVKVFTENDGWEQTALVFTNSLGEYTVPNLAGGNVKIFAEYTNNDDLQTVWYANGYSKATATTIGLPGAGAHGVIDIVMPLGATITGDVRDPIGAPVRKITVTATGAGLDHTDQDGSHIDGLYKLQGLHPQDYTLTTYDSFGLFADITPQNVTAVAGTPLTANLVVTPALVDESEFVKPTGPISGPTTVEPGKTYTWVVQPDGDDTVYAILYSSPVYLGAAVRNPDNSATLTLTIPASTPVGTHKLTLSSMDNSGEDRELEREYFTITVAGPTLAATGVDAAPIGALALLLGGLGLAGVLSTRRFARR